MKFELKMELNGQEKVFARERHLDLSDLENALVLQLNQRKRAEKAEKGHESANDIKQNLQDIGRFLVRFFDNQFTVDQAISGLAPSQGLEIDTFVMAALGENTETAEKADEEQEAKK